MTQLRNNLKRPAWRPTDGELACEELGTAQVTRKHWHPESDCCIPVRVAAIAKIPTTRAGKDTGKLHGSYTINHTGEEFSILLKAKHTTTAH